MLDQSKNLVYSYKSKFPWEGFKVMKIPSLNIFSNNNKNRIVKFDNQEIKLSGQSGDPYFDNINLGDKSNDFLINISQQWLKPDATIFDVGANIGLTSAIFSISSPNGKIFSFEPSPKAFSFLCKTINLNDMKNCSPMNLALGAEPGELQFCDNPTSASASHLCLDEQTLGGSTISVSVSTVDRFVKEKNLDRVDLIKIDVEGFEPDVLSGSENTLSNLKPSVFLEFNSFCLIAFRNINPRSFIEKLMSMFPFVYRFDNGQVFRINDEPSLLTFIHDNLMKRGCVDDLFCSYEKLY